MGWIDDKFKDLVKTGKDILPYAAMAAPFIPGFNAGVMGLMGKYAPWMEGALKSKFMNSAIGTAGKDALMKYALSAASGAENPELVGRRAFWSSLPYSWLKTGGDWQQMLGNAPDIDVADYTKEVTATIPGVEKWSDPAGAYGNVMPKLSYVPTKYEEAMGPNVIGDYPFLTNLDGQKVTEWGFDAENLKEQTDLMKPGRWFTTPEKTITKTIIPSPLETFEQMSQDAEPPLAGLDYVMRKKTKPSIFDTLMKKEAPLGVEVGSDAYNDFFGIGEMELDPYYLGKTLFDFMAGGKTAGDLEEDEEEDYQKMLSRMAITPSGSLEGFLGNKGGIASLNNGGMPGPYTDPMMSDDFNVNVQDVLTSPAYESIDDLGNLFEEDITMSEPHPMEGWYNMYDDMINSGEFKGTFDEFMEMINNSDYDVPMAARGGKIGMYGGGELNAIPGGTISGPGTETSDSIPAQLSNNEFVFTADAVRAAGGGDIDAGAQKMYSMMNTLDPNSAKPGDPPQYA